MVVAKDAVSNVVAGTGNLSWTHTPVGTPKAIIVFIVHINGSADEITSVTYGGVAMTEVAGSPNLKAASEAGSVYCYFLGAGVPAEAQTVAITVGAASSKRPVAISLTANGDCVVQDSDGTINSDEVTDPSVILTHNGKACFDAIAFYSGGGGPVDVTPLASWTAELEHDFGLTTGGFYTYDTVDTANVTAGWTQTTEDAVAIAIAVTEKSGGGGGGGGRGGSGGGGGNPRGGGNGGGGGSVPGGSGPGQGKKTVIVSSRRPQRRGLIGVF